MKSYAFFKNPDHSEFKYARIFSTKEMKIKKCANYLQRNLCKSPMTGRRST